MNIEKELKKEFAKIKVAEGLNIDNISINSSFGLMLIERIIAKNFEENHGLRPLGIAKTIGELKKLIEGYPDETSFGFRNQPMQVLYEYKYEDATYVVFQ